MTAHAKRAITIAILAMGGEGGGVLADWIVDLGGAQRLHRADHVGAGRGAAHRRHHLLRRTLPARGAEAAGAAPVLALMPLPGDVDVVLASELMEAGRALQRGLVTADRTTLVASTHRVYSMTEKIAMGDGRVDADEAAGRRSRGGEALHRRRLRRAAEAPAA
jgi:indolepyruvate ferredoxin oxidoreductase beta subunit